MNAGNNFGLQLQNPKGLKAPALSDTENETPNRANNNRNNKDNKHLYGVSDGVFHFSFSWCIN